MWPVNCYDYNTVNIVACGILVAFCVIRSTLTHSVSFEGGGGWANKRNLASPHKHTQVENTRVSLSKRQELAADSNAITTSFFSDIEEIPSKKLQSRFRLTLRAYNFRPDTANTSAKEHHTPAGQLQPCQ